MQGIRKELQLSNYGFTPQEWAIRQVGVLGGMVQGLEENQKH